MERSLEKGDFVLASGARSSYYIDARRTTFSAAGQFLVGLEAFRVLEGAGFLPGWVGGLTMGADPVACAIAHRSWLEGRPMEAFSVRKQPKAHGTGQQIEGGLPSDATAVIVEDSLTTGSSSLRAVQAVEAHGVRVLAVLALVDREEGGGRTIEDAGYPFISLYTAAELLAASGSDD